MGGFYALIMAGGSGTRLWPLSRQGLPKQALPLVGERTMFQHAVERLAPLFRPEDIYVVTGADHLPILRSQASQLPPENFIAEPVGRNTAPAIGLGAIHMRRRDPEGVMAVLTADHYIHREEEFRKVLVAARQAAEAGHLVTLGIRPSYPATGFGYIQRGKPLQERDGFAVYRVAGFTEKPDLETAIEFVRSGDYSWNSGMFIWRIDRIMEEFARQMPDLNRHLERIAAALGTPEAASTLGRIWPRVASQSIDYGVMEGAPDVAVIPVDIGWSDVGSWSALLDILPGDELGNVVRGQHVGVDTKGSLVFNMTPRLVATIGLERVIVVNTDDVILVCPVERAQDVKNIVKHLEGSGGEDYL